MKSLSKIHSLSIFAGLLFMLSAPAFVGAGTFELEIREAKLELRPGLTTSAWAYNGVVPGTPIVAVPGERVTIAVRNLLPVATNIHWHGLSLPNDQDGPFVLINPGATFTYSFTPAEPGTYWYHSHKNPVLDQMDMGLYGAFIVKDPTDSKYSGDHTFILDDWYLGARGERLPGTARGMMERFGNVESVNGKTGTAIEALGLKQGELHKLRFINASTAAVHTLKIDGHLFRVTHADGHPLAEPYTTDTITISPGERIDAELAATGTPGTSYAIRSADRDLGIGIPVRYSQGGGVSVVSPFVPPESHTFPGIFEKAPDKILVLNSGMLPAKLDDGMGHMMSGMATGPAGIMGTIWTINGKSYPETDPIRVKVGQVMKLRIQNDDTAMEPMDHPIHIHGGNFQVVSVDGEKPDRETWKDTINVPAGEFVDIAFVMTNPGDWMLHCHIIDHEDNGMTMMIWAQ